MKWLRERPERSDELDMVDHKGRWKAERGGEDDKDAVLGLGGEGRGKTGTKGQLFDDEDDEVDDDEEEEEEEDAVKGAQAPAVPAKAETRRR